MRHSPVEAIGDLVTGIRGLFLKCDFCAEHEGGIEELKELLKIDDTLLGVDGRTTGKDIDPKILVFGETPTYLWLWIDELYRSSGEGKTLKSLLKHPETSSKDSPQKGAWDDSSIGIWVHKKRASKEIITGMKLIVNALKNEERLVVMKGGGGNPFGGGGLVISPRSVLDKLPQINKNLMEHDLEVIALKKVWTPVEAHLKALMQKPTFNKYQQRYYAESEYYRDEKTLSVCYLGPKSLEKEPVKDSKYPFMLWLNPNVQRLYASGWYTVEQIEAWTRGEGPVIDNGTFPQLYKAQEIIAAGGVAYPLDYYALCRCGHIHYDGNASGRNEMLGRPTERSWATDRVQVIKTCPKCGKSAEDMIFSTDNPEHWTNKKKDK